MKNKILLFLILICTITLTVYPIAQLYHHYEVRNEVSKVQQKIDEKKMPSKDSVARAVQNSKSKNGISEADINGQNSTIDQGNKFGSDQAEGQTNPYTGDVFSQSNTKDFEPSTYSGAVGYIYIPKINVLELLYLGASQEHLYLGVAQMSGTSLPLSGEGHQTVIAGHRGGYTSPQFLYVDQLQAGDHIYVNYLGEKGVYTVFRQDVISNYGQNGTLTDIPDIDMLTLYTCHPYPQNYERLLVRSVRDTSAPFDTPQVTTSQQAYAEEISATNNFSTSNVSSAETSTEEIDKSISDANKALNQENGEDNSQFSSQESNKLKVIRDGKEAQENTISEKISNVFTSATNRYQIQLLLIWAILGILVDVKIIWLLVKEFRKI